MAEEAENEWENWGHDEFVSQLTSKFLEEKIEKINIASSWSYYFSNAEEAYYEENDGIHFPEIKIVVEKMTEKDFEGLING